LRLAHAHITAQGGLSFDDPVALLDSTFQRPCDPLLRWLVAATSSPLSLLRYLLYQAMRVLASDKNTSLLTTLMNLIHADRI
jgi:hypothetical protein